MSICFPHRWQPIQDSGPVPTLLMDDKCSKCGKVRPFEWGRFW